MSENFFDFNNIKVFNNIKIGDQKNFEFNLNNPTEPSRSNQFIIIYGSNGSGKSSISNSLNKLAMEEVRDKNKTNDRQTVTLTCETIQSFEDFRRRINPYSICVYNQEYIDTKVRVSNGDLAAIVMLGAEAEDKEMIERLEELGRKIVGRLELKSEKSGGLDSIIIEKIRKIEREYYIKVNKLRRSRTEKTLRSIYEKELNNFVPKSTLYDLNTESKVLDGKLKSLEKNRRLTSEKQVVIDIDKLVEIDLNLEKMAKEIEEPKLNERETKIVDIIKGYNKYSSWLTDSKEVTQKLENICPLCFSNIETVKVIKKIEGLLDPNTEEVEKEFRIKLNKIVALDEKNSEYINQNFRMNKYNYIDQRVSELIDTIEESRSTLHREVAEIKTLMDEKIDNIFTNFDFDLLDRYVKKYNKEVKRINGFVKEIENILNRYNKRVTTAKNETQKQIDKLNQKIKTYTIHSVIKEFNKYRQVNGHINFLEKIRGNLSDKTLEIKGKFRDLSRAEKEINKALRFIFFDPDKMQVELVQKENEVPGYKVLINNRPVSQNKLSTGEQNILALIYFYQEIYEGAEIEEINKAPKFIVLDDPISSLDENNLVGLISYINSRNKTILNNPKSRIVLFTHRWYVFDSLVKLSNNSTKFELIRENDITVQKYIGNKGHIRGYSEFLLLIWDFIDVPTDEKKSSIGNTIRKTMEAFSTFNYNEGFDTVIQSLKIKEIVLSKFDEEHFKEFYESFQLYASRLIVNTESHQKDNIKNLGREFNDFRFTLDELVRISKGWIGFLYMYNKEHLFKHLVTKGNKQEKRRNQKKQTIETWIKEFSLVES